MGEGRTPSGARGKEELCAGMKRYPRSGSNKKMQYKTYIVGIEDQVMEAELNRFLRSVRVLQVQKEFVDIGTQSFWSFCVEYIESSAVTAKNVRSKVDYKEVLSPKDFELFSSLRELRKALATEEAIPVYAVCTNAQLAEMASHSPKTLQEFKKIEGLGSAKVEKYGEKFVEFLSTNEQG